jgi:hypothetical protein
MATFMFVGDEERTFETGIGRAPATVAGGVLLYIEGQVQMRHAMNADLVPHDADTRRQVELIREQVRIADARDFALGTPPKGVV